MVGYLRDESTKFGCIRCTRDSSCFGIDFTVETIAIFFNGTDETDDQTPSLTCHATSIAQFRMFKQHSRIQNSPQGESSIRVSRTPSKPRTELATSQHDPRELACSHICDRRAIECTLALDVMLNNQSLAPAADRPNSV